MGREKVELDVHLSLDKEIAAGWVSILQSSDMSPSEYLTNAVTDAVNCPSPERVYMTIRRMSNTDRDRLADIIESCFTD